MSKMLRAKYQINPNILVQCYLDVINTQADQVQVHVGIRRKADTQLPVGTKFLIRPEDSAGLFMPEGEGQGFEVVTVQVRDVAKVDDKFLHTCAPVKRDNYPERRKETRKTSRFFLQLAGSDAKFQVENATNEGFGLSYKSSHAMLSLNLESGYDFVTFHKGGEYKFHGQLKHILYNWKTYEHTVGLALEPVTDESLQTVLNILIDPDYTVNISHKEKIDTAEGKVSKIN